jgi:hypothetical protein
LSQLQSILAPGYINHGRDLVFDRFDDLHALQRSEILDLVMCGDALIQPKTPITSPARKEADKRT